VTATLDLQQCCIAELLYFGCQMPWRPENVQIMGGGVCTLISGALILCVSRTGRCPLLFSEGFHCTHSTGDSEAVTQDHVI